MKIYICGPSGRFRNTCPCRIFGISTPDEKPTSGWTAHAVLDFMPSDGFMDALLKDITFTTAACDYADNTFASPIADSSAVGVLSSLNAVLGCPQFCRIPYVLTERIGTDGECMETRRRVVTVKGL